MKKKLNLIISAIIGAVLGYTYYYFIGCDNGCTIQSDWRLSTLYGAFAGYVLAMPIKKPTKDKEIND